jgi:hypothetical protein
MASRENLYQNCTKYVNRMNIKKEFQAEPLKLTLLLQRRRRMRRRRRRTTTAAAATTTTTTTTAIIIIIHCPYLTAVLIVLKRLEVSLTMHFLFTVLPKTFKLYSMYQELLLSSLEYIKDGQD